MKIADQNADIRAGQKIPYQFESIGLLISLRRLPLRVHGGDGGESEPHDRLFGQRLLAMPEQVQRAPSSQVHMLVLEAIAASESRTG